MNEIEIVTITTEAVSAALPLVDERSLVFGTLAIPFDAGERVGMLRDVANAGLDPEAAEMALNESVPNGR